MNMGKTTYTWTVTRTVEYNGVKRVCPSEKSVDIVNNQVKAVVTNKANNGANINAPKETNCDGTIVLKGNDPELFKAEANDFVQGTWTINGAAVNAPILLEGASNSSVIKIQAPMTNQGQSVLRWTIVKYSVDEHGNKIAGSQCPLTGQAGFYDEVTIQNNKIEAKTDQPNVNTCETYAEISANDVEMEYGTAAQGTWTVLNVPDGLVATSAAIAAAIDSPHSPVTTVRGLTQPGLYTYRWTVQKGDCLFRCKVFFHTDRCKHTA